MSERRTERAALERICADLGLPRGDAWTQDWAYELGEQYRTEAYVGKYLAAYSNQDTVILNVICWLNSFSMS